MYESLGLSELGAMLSCGRDAALIEGFNSNISFERTQTILGGASHCDFQYPHLPFGTDVNRILADISMIARGSATARR